MAAIVFLHTVLNSGSSSLTPANIADKPD